MGGLTVLLSLKAKPTKEMHFPMAINLSILLTPILKGQNDFFFEIIFEAL